MNLKLQIHWQIFIAIALGVLFGIFLPSQIHLVGWMGDFFMRLLKMLIIPLILSSIISGVINIGGSKNFKRLGLKTFSYYIFTSFVAIVTGLFFVNLIQPGVGESIPKFKDVSSEFSGSVDIAGQILNIVPKNIFGAMVNDNVISIIFFAILVGYFITKLADDKKEILSKIVDAGFELMMKITMFIVSLAPIGIFGLIAQITVDNADKLNQIAGTVSMYLLTVCLGLFVHAIINLSLALKFIGKINPLSHFKAMKLPLLTAFSTSSSAATLPLTINAVEKNAGVSNKISSFTLPLGATINMDGTALYECVAAIFIAQIYGYDLSMVQQISIVAIALLTSIGAAAIPMAGLFMTTVILSALNIPLEGIGIVIIVDRIVDMVRTAVNVFSDSCAAVIIAKSEGEPIYDKQ